MQSSIYRILRLDKLLVNTNANEIKMLLIQCTVLPGILCSLTFLMDVSLPEAEFHLRIFRCTDSELLTHMFLCVICTNYADQKKPRK